MKESDIPLPKGKKKKQRREKKNELPSQSGNPLHGAKDKDSYPPNEIANKPVGDGHHPRLITKNK